MASAVLPNPQSSCRTMMGVLVTYSESVVDLQQIEHIRRCPTVALGWTAARSERTRPRTPLRMSASELPACGDSPLGVCVATCVVRGNQAIMWTICQLLSHCCSCRSGGLTAALQDRRQRRCAEKGGG